MECIIHPNQPSIIWGMYQYGISLAEAQYQLYDLLKPYVNNGEEGEWIKNLIINLIMQFTLVLMFV